MIETAEAVRNLDAILDTPGLDGVYIGPADLTLGLTGRRYRTGFDREEPEIVAAIQQILAAAHRAGKRAGLHNGTPEYAAKAVSWGFDLVTVSNDVQLLRSAAAASVQRFHQLQGTPRRPGAFRRRRLLMPHVLVAGKIHPQELSCCVVRRDLPSN
jgi:4-hydroxy-2-oxoheptanedioate aldolase